MAAEFTDFTKALLDQIAASHGIPFEDLKKDFGRPGVDFPLYVFGDRGSFRRIGFLPPGAKIEQGDVLARDERTGEYFRAPNRLGGE